MFLVPATCSRSIGARVRTGLSLVLIALSRCAWAAGEPPTKAGESIATDANEDRESIVLAAREYKLFLGKDRLALDMEPVLRWPNATRGTPEGATFVWTRDGRPEAIACIWKDKDALGFAFQSLSLSSLVAEHGQQPVWHPLDGGIHLQDFPEAPVPAGSPARRLSQMRDLARRFRCRVISEREKEELRLLPSPIYRYKTEAADVFDGALFAYAQGTDPEVVLLLETQRSDGQSAWRFALTRRSCLALQADLDGRHVWSVPEGIGAAGDVWFHGSSSVPVTLKPTP
jgi:hypothetical protein